MAAPCRNKILGNFSVFGRLTSRFSTVSNISTARPIGVDKLNVLMQWYEDVIGLTEVKSAQSKVTQAEVEFVRIQGQRQNEQHVLNELQSKLRDISAELDRLNRGDPAFLEAITKQHAMLREEMTILEKYKSLEKDERVKFGLLSAALRESHEKERQRTERTKYWSVIGSVIGALIGITGATVNNYLRNRQLKQLNKTVVDQHEQIQSILTDFRKSGAELTSDQDFDQILKNNEKLSVELGDIKQLIVTQGGRGLGEGTVVYVGPQIEGLLEGLADDLEYKIKINSLATVAFVYGAFAVAIPILYAIFSGGG